MAILGTDIRRDFDLRISKAYSQYYPDIQLNRHFKSAMIKCFENRYNNLDTQGNEDQISRFIKTNVVFALTNNEIFTSTIGSPNISDYEHFLAAKAKFFVTLDVTVSDATNVSPVVLKFTNPNNIRTQDVLSITGATGNTAINTTVYLKRLNSLNYELYSDAKFTTPIVGNGIYTGGAVIQRIYYNYCKPYVSDRKISKYLPTVSSPQQETADKKLKFYPLDQTASEITIDYISTYTYIDVADTVIDYEIIYSRKFVDYLIDEAVLLFSGNESDQQRFQVANQEIITNP